VVRARGATVVLVPPEQSADLRDYYNKHTKTDRLDSRVLARLPLLHPDGTWSRSTSSARPSRSSGPCGARSSLVERRTGCFQRLDALVELLGPAWADVLGTGDYGKAALAVLERYADPHALKRAGRNRLTAMLIRHSRGAWREAKADALLAAADETLMLWAAAGWTSPSSPRTSLPRSAHPPAHRRDRRARGTHHRLYDDADPAGIVISAPGWGHAGRRDPGPHRRPQPVPQPRRRAAFTGLVPKIDQSGTTEPARPTDQEGRPRPA
jgi:hypothetical protein